MGQSLRNGYGKKNWRIFTGSNKDVGSDENEEDVRKIISIGLITFTTGPLGGLEQRRFFK